MDKNFNEAISLLPPKTKAFLEKAAADFGGVIYEICFRSEKPLMLITSSGTLFITKNGALSEKLPDFPLTTTKQQLAEILRALTEYSLHSFKNEINSGFITVKGGHRAGVVGTAVYDKGELISVNDVSSINLRIARTLKNSALSLSKILFSEGICSALIVGSPSSGKTTLLKDISRLVSENRLNLGYKKVAVVDERGEISATYQGVSQNEIGFGTDVLNGYNKENGMDIAIRSMSPDLIILDEITREKDAELVRKSMNSGVNVIATAHAGDNRELYFKEHLRKLVLERDFQNIVFLKGRESPSEVSGILKSEELIEKWQGL